jgi:hypothetical protein
MVLALLFIFSPKEQNTVSIATNVTMVYIPDVSLQREEPIQEKLCRVLLLMGRVLGKQRTASLHLDHVLGF